MKYESQRPLLTCPATRITPIIKVVGDRCNIACDYCYYINKYQDAPHKIMSFDILDSFISQYLSLFSGQVDFLWHGGEPLLAGIDFYKQAVKLQKNHASIDHKVCNAIQTNGILINEQWVEFFKENDFQVGISLDGVENCHNRFRKDQEGNGSFEKVVNAIQLLKSGGIEPKILQVATKSSIADIPNNFSLFADQLNIKNWGINVFCDVDGTNHLLSNESLSNDDYYLLYRSYFDLWLEKNDPDLVIREIDDFIAGVLGKQTRTCTTSGICTSFMVFDWDGMITPSCDNLLFVSKHSGRSINEYNLIDILQSVDRITFARKVNSFPDACLKCKWFSACFNGCTYHRKNGIDGKYYYCQGRKQFFSYLCSKLIDNSHKNDTE